QTIVDQTAMEENLLAAAKRVWSKVEEEMKAVEDMKEGLLLSPDELKKVSKYLQNTVTKFSASATVVSDAEEAKRALTPIAGEADRQVEELLTLGVG
ncbi:unnamed protein product, partial [Effrenium voratum]